MAVVPVYRPLAPRCVALVTRDPSLYSEIAGALRERKIPCVSLLPGDRIPDRVAVVITTPREAQLVDHVRVLPVPEGGDRHALWAAVGDALLAPAGAPELIVGVDPGPRPGYAVMSGNSFVGEGVLESPEASVRFADHLRHRFPTRSIRYRVGSGDPPSRNRIVNGLLERRRRVELVDEQGTTPRGHRRPRDMLAARRIAVTEGRDVYAPIPTTVTEGEVANLQRLSRIGSGGRITIPRSVAHRVLRGELTLSEALAASARSDRPASPPPRGEISSPRELL